MRTDWLPPLSSLQYKWFSKRNKANCPVLCSSLVGHYWKFMSQSRINIWYKRFGSGSVFEHLPPTSFTYLNSDLWHTQSFSFFFTVCICVLLLLSCKQIKATSFCLVSEDVYTHADYNTRCSWELTLQKYMKIHRTHAIWENVNMKRITGLDAYRLCSCDIAPSASHET